MVQVQRQRRKHRDPSKWSKPPQWQHYCLLAVLMVGGSISILLQLRPYPDKNNDPKQKARTTRTKATKLLKGSDQSSSVTTSKTIFDHHGRIQVNELPLDQKHRLAGFDGESIMLRSAIMPAIGYGTCCRPTAKGDDIYVSTMTYLADGGRLLDTAMAYGNHKDIGKAIQDSFSIQRNEIWITSKISPSKLTSTKIHIAENTVAAVKGIVKELSLFGVDAYLDLCLIHTQKLGKESTIEIWKGLIEAQKQGLIKVIGVSNFNKHEIIDLYHATNVLPEVNQIQYHPWTTSEWKETVVWQHENQIATTAYNSLGGSRFHKSKTKNDDGDGWGSPIVSQLASKYGVTEAQLLLRWALQHQGVAVIPGSADPNHIEANLHLPIFVLEKDEMQQLESSNHPQGWWDPKRGPVKYLGEEATKSWQGDHTIST